VTPRDDDELAAALAMARSHGWGVRVVGAGHSFHDIAASDDLLIRLGPGDESRGSGRPTGFTGITAFDADSGLVTVRAGTPLHLLNRLLDDLGVAMSNLGDIDRQTIAGAISTGTHGTGARYPGLAAQVEAIRLMLADGSQVTCSAEQDPGLFAAARVSLGALGVLTDITVRCVPAFVLAADERPMSVDRVLSELDQLVADNDHFEFYWFPHTRRTLTKRNNRLPADASSRPLSPVRAWLDDEFLSNRVYELTNRLATVVPRLTPTINAIASRALTARSYSDVSHRVFVSPRRVVFREMEYAVPREALRDFLSAIMSWIERSGMYLPFPLEVRFAAADDIWLSPAYGRATGYVAVHQYHRLPYERYFREVERIAADFEGRPHWGKIHWLEAETLRDRYPRFDDFLRVRERLDPDGMFVNAHIRRLFAPK